MEKMTRFEFSGEESDRLIAGQALLLQRLDSDLNQARSDLAEADTLARERLSEIKELERRIDELSKNATDD